MKKQTQLPPKPHIKWFKNTGKILKTADGKNVEIWEFQHTTDEAVLSDWAKHFREHYCLDSKIDKLRGDKTRANYLVSLKFPNENTTLGRSLRAGDFGEILVADYLQWVLNHWVPRVRWSTKYIRDESPKGSDIIGFKFAEEDKFSSEDKLTVIENKTKLSSTKINRMQAAINGSARDYVRLGESLNYIKEKLLNDNQEDQTILIERFQSLADFPYKLTFGASVLYSSDTYNEVDFLEADSKKIPTSKSDEYMEHPFRDNLFLIAFTGNEMMKLINELYRRAADEA